MIVVIGSLSWRPAPPAAPAGRACTVALAAAAHGARAELVGRVGEDAAGEALLMALAKAGVGHAAVLRDPARGTPIEAAPAPNPDGDEDEAAFLLGDLPLASGTPAPPATASATPSPAEGPRLEPADVELGIRYLEPSGVIVVTDDATPDVVGAAAEASRYAEARLVVLLPPGRGSDRGLPGALPEDATVLAAPDGLDEGAFAELVGSYAAALDAGLDPAQAFAAAQGETGWVAAAAD